MTLLRWANMRTEDWRGRVKQWAKIYNSSALGSLIIQHWRGLGVTSSHPQITDPQLMLQTKGETMASQWTNPTHITTTPHQPPGSCPDTWLRPNQCDPTPIPWRVGKKHNKRSFSEPSLSSQEQKIHLKHSLLHVCLWTGCQMLVWRAEIISEGPEEF